MSEWSKGQALTIVWELPVLGEWTEDIQVFYT